MTTAKKYALIAGIGGLFVVSMVVLYLLVQFYNPNYTQQVNNGLAALTKNTILGTVKIPAVKSGLPTRLTIPVIKVDAPIIQVGLTADGSVDVPKGPSEVAWYNLGPKPGEKGSSVIVGHYGKWQNGANSVFDNLNKLKKGDKIYVKNDKDEITTFVVQQMHSYNPNETVPDIFNKDDGNYLNLITCSGEWLPGKQTYNKRLVIFTEKLVP